MFKRLSLLAVASLLAVGAFADQYAVDQLHARVVKAAGPERAALEAQLDKACAQKDCVTSRLYWTTDLEEAKRAAQQTGRPIIALHLLGRLDQELSCANSRFFRTTLYSDASIASLLRDDFVLYWHSVRPVPRITIEFGDGRKIQQTITGNSAHYLLSPDGAVLDALPGLYSPSAFREQLVQWIDLNRRMAGRRDTADVLRRFHAERLAAAKAQLALLTQKTGVRIRPSRTMTPMTAMEATRRTMSKAALDIRVLESMDASLRSLAPSDWAVLGTYEAGSVRFSPSAVALIRQKQFGAAQPKPGEMEALLENLSISVAADTIFDECELHAAIHRWFVDGEVTDLASLNARVYEELFLTPDDDPWLGLKPPTVFTAIAN